jgi:hypothetical protein
MPSSGSGSCRWSRGAYFLATIPLAVVAPATTLYSWILLFPLSVLIHRRMPASVAAYFDS